MNKKLLITTIGFGIIAGIVLYLAPAAAETTIDPTTLEECYNDTDRVLAVAGKYIAKEATAQRLIKDLQDIINEKDAEVALLNKQIHHLIIKP